MPRFPDPEGRFTFLVLRPASDLFLWAWRLERRTEWAWRPTFDRRLRPPTVRCRSAVAEPHAQGRGTCSGGGARASGRGRPDPGDHRRDLEVHPGELAARRGAAFRQHQDLRCPAWGAHCPRRGPGQPPPRHVCPTGDVPLLGAVQRTRPLRPVGPRGPGAVLGRHQGDGCTGREADGRREGDPGPDPGVAGQLRDPRRARERRPAEVGARQGTAGLPDQPSTVPADPPGHADAVLPDAQQPARGAVLLERAVPARRGPGGRVLAEAQPPWTHAHPTSPRGELPPCGHGPHADRRLVGHGLHGAGADRPPLDADRGRDGEVARAAVTVRRGRPFCTSPSSASTRTASSGSPTSSGTTHGTASPSIGPWGARTGRAGPCTGSWLSCASG